MVHVRSPRKELRKKHRDGTEDVTTPECCCEDRDDLSMYRACLPVRCYECRDGGPVIYSDGL